MLAPDWLVLQGVIYSISYKNHVNLTNDTVMDLHVFGTFGLMHFTPILINRQLSFLFKDSLLAMSGTQAPPSSKPQETIKAKQSTKGGREWDWLIS